MQAAPPMTSPAEPAHTPPAKSKAGQVVALVLSWAAVSVPLAWGVTETLLKALALFQ